MTVELFHYQSPRNGAGSESHLRALDLQSVSLLTELRGWSEQYVIYRLMAGEGHGDVKETDG